MNAGRRLTLSLVSLVLAGLGLLLNAAASFMRDPRTSSDTAIGWVALVLGVLSWLLALVVFFRSRRNR